MLLVSGCRPEAVSPTPFPFVSMEVLGIILAHFVKELGLQFSNDDVEKDESGQPEPTKPEEAQRVDRHIGFFVMRRADFLGEQNPSLIGEPDYVTLKARILSEIQAVTAYVEAKLDLEAPGPLSGAIEPGGPATGPKNQVFVASPSYHLNLEDLGFTHSVSRTGLSSKRTKEYVASRRRAVTDICWRAAALHDEVWQASADQTSAVLRDIDPAPPTGRDPKWLGHILDRRLRAIERMRTQISSRTALGAAGSYAGQPAVAPPGSGASEHGWTDKLRVRPIEYPRVANTTRMINAIGAGNIESVDQPHYQQNGKPWAFLDGRIANNRYPFPGVRFAPSIAADWQQPVPSYQLKLVNSSAPGEAIGDLFATSFDWWDRSWLFCDHVVSSLHVEALRFSLLRKSPNGSDDEFDALATNPQGYVVLSAFVGAGTTTPPTLLSDDQNPDSYFHNGPVSEGEFEVGDQLIMWNHPLYSFISRGEWRLENALLMEVDSKPRIGGIDRNKLVLQGHGTEPRDYLRYQEDVIAGELRKELKAVQSKARSQPANVSSFHFRGSSIVRWDPYDYFQGGAPWWVVMNVSGTELFNTVASLKAGTRKSISAVEVPANATNAFPVTGDAILFPLYEPAVPDDAAPGDFAWDRYFSIMSANASDTSTPRRLQKVVVDGNVMPGFFLRGEAKPISGVQPRIRLTDS